MARCAGGERAMSEDIDRVTREMHRKARELLRGRPRKMTGFWATLSDEQKATALAYEGPETHGDPEFAFSKQGWTRL